MAKETTPKKKITQKMMQAPLQQWQKRLGLQDWDIKIKVVDQINHNDPVDQATCEVFLELKKAKIMMCREDDTPIQTLVHELLHIHGRPIEDVLEKHNETYLHEVHWEQMIEMLAKALMEKQPKLWQPTQTAPGASQEQAALKQD